MLLCKVNELGLGLLFDCMSKRSGKGSGRGKGSGAGFDLPGGGDTLAKLICLYLVAIAQMLVAIAQFFSNCTLCVQLHVKRNLPVQLHV